MPTAGFTLVELMLTAVLLATAATLAAPLYRRARGALDPESGARALAAAATEASDRAARTGAVQRLRLNEDGSWRLTDASGAVVVLPVGARRAPSGVALRAAAGEVVFFPDGSATPLDAELSRDGAAWRVRRGVFSVMPRVERR
jgi:prepilin-type N-terminal cleavage/methylation domain-containing protein